MSAERYNRVCDLNTTEGAREFIAAIFIHQLQRHDFTTYIEKQLAGDFACVLARYFCTAREAAEAETIRANVAVADCNDAEALLERSVNALIHVTECYGLEPATLTRIEAIIEDHAQGDGLSNLEHEPVAADSSPAVELVRCRAAWELERSEPYAGYAAGWMAATKKRATPYDRRSDLASYFGLSYASWLTLPRVLMEAMPDEWKKRIALLLHEYSETYTNQPDYGTTVRVTVGGKLVETPDWLINYRHPNREMISQLQGKKAPAVALVGPSCATCLDVKTVITPGAKWASDCPECCGEDG